MTASRGAVSLLPPGPQHPRADFASPENPHHPRKQSGMPGRRGAGRVSSELVIYPAAHICRLGPSRARSDVFNLPFGCSHLCDPLTLETLSKRQRLAGGSSPALRTDGALMVTPPVTLMLNSLTHYPSPRTPGLRGCPRKPAPLGFFQQLTPGAKSCTVTREQANSLPPLEITFCLGAGMPLPACVTLG